MHPETLIIKAVLFIRTTGPRVLPWAASLPWWKIAAGALLVVLALLAAFAMIKSAQPDIALTSTKHNVEVKSVAELSSETSPLSLVGVVSSKSEATVRAETSGQVVGVYKALGDHINAGAVAAEIENASERAAVLQAQGGVEAAQANLAKTTGGVRAEQKSILEASVANAQATLEAARSSALTTLLSAYASVDNAIRGTTDKMFTNPGYSGSRFNIESADFRLTSEVESTRDIISQYLAREAAASNSLTTSSNLAAEISTTQTEVRAARNFLDLVVSNPLTEGNPLVRPVRLE